LAQAQGADAAEAMCDFNDSCGCEGREVQTKLNYVGEGRGHYTQVESYNYVGDGQGSFEKEEETSYENCTPKAYPICTCGLTLIIACLSFVYLLNGDSPSFGSSAPAAPPPVTAAPAAATATPATAPSAIPGARYQCSGNADDIIAAASGNYPAPPPCSGGAIAAAAMLETAWLIADVDGDGGVSLQDLELCKLRALVSAKVLKLFHSGTHDGDGALTHSEVIDTLTKAGLNAAGVPGVFSASNVEVAVKEAAWIVADRDGDGRLSRPELARFARRQQLSVHALKILHAGDTNGDGSFSHSEFFAALPRLGAEAALYPENARAVVSAAAVEVAWVAIDVDLDDRASAKEVAALVLRKQLPVKAPFMLLQASQHGALNHNDFATALDTAGFSKDFIAALADGRTPDSKVFDSPLALAAAKAAAQVVAMEAWSLPKMLWCCEHQGIGCTTRRTTKRPPTVARLTTAKTTSAAPAITTRSPVQWKSATPALATTPPPPGPTTTTTTTLFHCEGQSSEWSVPQKVYCCRLHHMGCPATPRLM